MSKIQILSKLEDPENKSTTPLKNRNRS